MTQNAIVAWVETIERHHCIKWDHVVPENQSNYYHQMHREWLFVVTEVEQACCSSWVCDL